MKYCVIDTNVLVSSLISKNSNSPTVRIIDLIPDGLICPIYNDFLLFEYDEILHRKKFHLEEQTIFKITDLIINFGLKILPKKYYGEMIDEDDRIFLETFYAVENSYLVTGNLKHFPKLPFIVSPAEMMKIIEK